MPDKYLTAMLKLYEDKLKEYMTSSEYSEFAEQVARTVFLAEVMDSPSEEFRQTVIDHWDEITAPVVTGDEE